MPKITGIMYATVDGESLPMSEGSGKLNIGGKERTVKKGGNRVRGYVEKVMEATFECTLDHTADVDLIAMRDWVDKVLVVETDTGVRYSVANACVTNPHELSESEGEVSFAMAGDPAIQI